MNVTLTVCGLFVAAGSPIVTVARQREPQARRAQADRRRRRRQDYGVIVYVMLTVCGLLLALPSVIEAVAEKVPTEFVDLMRM